MVLFDFSKEALNDFFDFDMVELMNFDWNK